MKCSKNGIKIEGSSCSYNNKCIYPKCINDMKTLNQLIKELQELKKKGYGELPVIYSSDSEGNSYEKVYASPSEFLVEDINEWQLNPAIEFDENDNVLPFIPNCVIIN